MIIEIRGVQFTNKGAELMLCACLDQIKKHWPNAKVALAPNANSPYQARALLGALQKLPFRFRGYDFNRLSYWLPKRLRQFLLQWFGIVFEVDIDLVLDASGFSYGDQWGGRNIQVLCNEIVRLQQNQKGYILLPQAFGPFNRQVDQQRLQRGLPKALLVCARDDISFGYLKRILGPIDVLQQFADFTNLVKPLMADRTHKNRCLLIPNAAMLSAKNRNLNWQTAYITVLKQCCDEAIGRGMQVVLLNHEGAADAALCHQLSNKFLPKLEVVEEADPRKVKGWIAQSQLVVSSRFHGCVSALSLGVPCIGTSWSHKYEALFAEYLQSDCLLQPEVTAAQLRLTFDNATQLAAKPEVIAVVSQFKQQSELMWNLVAAKVKQLKLPS